MMFNLLSYGLMILDYKYECNMLLLIFGLTTYLKKRQYKLISENDKLISENDKLISENDKLLEELNKKKNKDGEYGEGPLRYKSNCGEIYYHGMGHLENRFMWYSTKMHHKIIEYKNKEKALMYPDFETHNIASFCNNCEYCEDSNKKKRNKFYYLCKGHKLNVE